MYPASAVILAVGGFAAPKTGSDGSAFSWLEQLGHTTVPTKPALVPFYTEPKLVHPLKGIRIPAEVSAVSESGTVLAKDTGEVQFTERTISGICVMNLSARCCKEEPTMLSLRLLPNIASQKNRVNFMGTLRHSCKLETGRLVIRTFSEKGWHTVTSNRRSYCIFGKSCLPDYAITARTSCRKHSVLEVSCAFSWRMVRVAGYRRRHFCERNR